MNKKSFKNKILALELTAFISIILIIWLNEIFDLPHYLFGADQTPINWIESLMETILISLLCGIIVFSTNRQIKKMKLLEGLLPICSSCKKIRDDNGYWKQVETYIHNHSDADFSHSLCDECAEKMYGDEDWYKQMKTEEK